jgi:membrane protease YdiL (CAAX protease family)
MLRTLLVPPRPEFPDVLDDRGQRRDAVVEILLVFSVTLGLSAARSLLSLLDSLLQPEPLADQSVALNVSRAAVGLIDLGFQLLSALQLAAWGGLGLYLLWRAGIAARQIGLDRSRPGRDALAGVGLAALIGLPGLGFYLVTRALGMNLTVVPSALNDTWWRIPVLVLAAVANAWAEEVLMLGYLLTRLRQLGWGENRSLAVSAVLRGSYHLYQGFGGFLGNIVMGLVFGRFWQRSGRLWPMVVAHSLIDLVAFVGYGLLRGHVSWLP